MVCCSEYHEEVAEGLSVVANETTSYESSA